MVDTEPMVLSELPFEEIYDGDKKSALCDIEFSSGGSLKLEICPFPENDSQEIKTDFDYAILEFDKNKEGHSVQVIQSRSDPNEITIFCTQTKREGKGIREESCEVRIKDGIVINVIPLVDLVYPGIARNDTDYDYDISPIWMEYNDDDKNFQVTMHESSNMGRLLSRPNLPTSYQEGQPAECSPQAVLNQMVELVRKTKLEHKIDYI